MPELSRACKTRNWGRSRLKVRIAAVILCKRVRSTVVRYHRARFGLGDMRKTLSRTPWRKPNFRRAFVPNSRTHSFQTGRLSPRENEASARYLRSTQRTNQYLQAIIEIFVHWKHLFLALRQFPSWRNAFNYENAPLYLSVRHLYFQF